MRKNVVRTWLLLGMLLAGLILMPFGAGAARGELPVLTPVKPVDKPSGGVQLLKPGFDERGELVPIDAAPTLMGDSTSVVQKAMYKSCTDMTTIFFYIVSASAAGKLDHWSLGLCNEDWPHNYVIGAYYDPVPIDCTEWTPGVADYWVPISFEELAPTDPANEIPGSWSVKLQKAVPQGSCMAFAIAVHGVWNFGGVPWSAQVGGGIVGGETTGPSCNWEPCPGEVQVVLTGGGPLCPGQTRTLYADTTGTVCWPGPLRYSWYNNGEPVPDSPNSPYLEVSQPGWYQVLVDCGDSPHPACHMLSNIEEVWPDFEPPVAVCKNITVVLRADGTAMITPQDVDGGSTDNCGIVHRSLDKDTFTTEDIGENTVVLTVYDAASNWDSCEAKVTVLPHELPDVPLILGAESPGLGGPTGDLTLMGLAADFAWLRLWVRPPGDLHFTNAGDFVADGCGHWEFTFTFEESGVYTFRVGARDVAGNWAWTDDLELELSPSVPIETVMLQQEVNGYMGTTDTWIGAWEPDTADGVDNRLRIRYGDDRSALIKFDLEGVIPDTANILHANLGVYSIFQSNMAAMTLEAYQMKTAWVEEEATYNMADAMTPWEVAGGNGNMDREMLAVGSALFSEEQAWYAFNVTEAARDWLADPMANHGVMLKGTESTSVQYNIASSEYEAACRRPALYVIFSGAAPLMMVQ